MTEQEIKAEHDRLRPILFEGAPDWAKYAVQNKKGAWLYVGNRVLKPMFHGSWEWTTAGSYYCKSQPKTTLHWTDTLIERGDA